METKADAEPTSNMRKLIRKNWIFIAWYSWVAALLAAIVYYFFG
jgi:hypothetical protein